MVDYFSLLLLLLCCCVSGFSSKDFASDEMELLDGWFWAARDYLPIGLVWKYSKLLNIMRDRKRMMSLWFLVSCSVNELVALLLLLLLLPILSSWSSFFRSSFSFVFFFLLVFGGGRRRRRRGHLSFVVEKVRWWSEIHSGGMSYLVVSTVSVWFAWIFSPRLPLNKGLTQFQKFGRSSTGSTFHSLRLLFLSFWSLLFAPKKWCTRCPPLLLFEKRRCLDKNRWKDKRSWANRKYGTAQVLALWDCGKRSF